MIDHAGRFVFEYIQDLLSFFRYRFNTLIVIGDIGKIMNQIISCFCPFFDIINLRTNKDGPHCLILTSNKTPDTWCSYFEEKDTTLCTLDRIFDDAIVYMMKGPSYRGKKLQTLAVEAQ